MVFRDMGAPLSGLVVLVMRFAATVERGISREEISIREVRRSPFVARHSPSEYFNDNVAVEVVCDCQILMERKLARNILDVNSFF